MSRSDRPERVPKPDRGNPTLAGLIDALATSPVLPGAACKGRAPLFDWCIDDQPDELPAYRRARHAQALELCRNCPALERCREWAADIPTHKLSGVVAGELRRTSRKGTRR